MQSLSQVSVPRFSARFKGEQLDKTSPYIMRGQLPKRQTPQEEKTSLKAVISKKLDQLIEKLAVKLTRDQTTK